ncbi:hypothetical protein SY83_02900 [Paenibacillus swuensis]|uniref:SHSP domain-containing protein n=1 Tax=Paenibacillus swuensis TaxID=1178515 RepID=A0A172TEW4_9BACL|nr:Hsp20/alpha crystallin family protein [Paenibacillus swuensis]ANE45444.1 hypothetical protein SY83_02900 [Paenibacillus swuensis]
MSPFNENNPLQPWAHFEQMFGMKLPRLPGGTEPEAIEAYVNEVIDRSLPLTAPVYPRALRAETFETHNSVIVKIRIPPKIKLRNLRVLIHPGHIKVEGLHRSRPQIIKLPTLVNKKRSKAVYRDGILQIQIRKHTANGGGYHEVYIR